MRKETSGVYIILCIQSWKYYVGSSIWIEKRWREHKSDLNLKVHGNIHLQRAWDKYGKDSFMFFVLEEVPLTTREKKDYWNLASKKLWPVEQRWLDLTQCYDPECGFNLSEIAGTAPFLSGEKSHWALLTMEQVREIRRRYSEGENPREIEKDYPIVRITQIISYNNYYEDDGLQEKIAEQKILNRSRFWKPPTEEAKRLNKLKNSGENNAGAKHTWEIIGKLRAEDPKTRLVDLAEKYDMFPENVSSILQNKSWVDPDYIPQPRIHPRPRKFTQEKVEQIREMHKNKISVKVIAEQFEVKEQYIKKILRGEIWSSRNKPSK